MKSRTLTDAQISSALRAHLPERAYPGLRERILDAAATTTQQRALPSFLGPQRHSWWPARRFPHVNNARLAIAAAAVVVVAVVGYNLLPRFGGFGGQPTPLPSPTSTPGASGRPAAIPNQSDIPPGTYRVNSFTNMPLTVALPAGWGHDVRDANFISKGDVFESNGVALATWQVTNVYDDSCHWLGTPGGEGHTAVHADVPQSIVAALTEQTGHQTSQPTSVSLGGQSATRMEFSLDAAFDVATCDDAIARLWPDPGPDPSLGLRLYPGQTTTIYVVDHGDRATLVIGIRKDDSLPGDVAELDKVLASVEFKCC
jgi:hypothetical protein